MKEFYPDANIQDAVLGEGTYFFSRADSIPINAEIIGEFILKEDLKTHWEPNKERIIEFARENKANGIIIDQLGWSLRGHAFYVKGRVFHLPEVEIKSLHLQNNLEFDCQISVYRDEGEPALGASAKASIKIYDHSIDNFKNRTYTNIKSSDCNSVIISINGRDYTFDESNKKNRYFKLSKMLVVIQVQEDWEYRWVDLFC